MNSRNKNIKLKLSMKDTGLKNLKEEIQFEFNINVLKIKMEYIGYLPNEGIFDASRFKGGPFST